MTLARSGLITQINPKALEVLGYRKNEMQAKPFTLFVARSDLVIFFSHWNELINSANPQSFEISLKHKTKGSIYARLECGPDPASSDTRNSLQIFLAEITDSRRAADQLQTLQGLLGLIFTVVDNISTVSEKHLRLSIEDALKKICLFTKADLSFIYHINRQLNRLDPVYQWQQSSADEIEKSKFQSISLSKVKRTIVKLRQDRVLVIHDAAKLASAEGDELQAWHQSKLGAIVYHLIYSGKIPIGIIGVAKKSAGEEWASEEVALVKFFGGFIAERLPFGADSGKSLESPQIVATQPERVVKSETVQGEAAVQNKEPSPKEKAEKEATWEADKPPRENWQGLPDMSRPMLLEKFSGGPAEEQQAVFLRDDGLVLLTCPHCGTQESVSAGRFDKLGSTIHVSCPCRKQFTAVLEKRRFFRKAVKLEGYFSVGGDLGPIGADGHIWGQMTVKDLSKAGLRFTSEKAHLVHLDDLLMVRFNLDNTNQALIHKPVRVISVSNQGIGCRFEGADNYDITLGFYFM
ncbi:MAG: PilZ domain-containing protein [Desulfobacteraceae bacterium]|nr:PilZ domain-containing protein [Desulfobacteraceae bacterium]